MGRPARGDPARAGGNVLPWLTGLARNEIQRVLARMARVEGVLVSPSAFADRDAFWVDGKEIAHAEGDSVDLRLTRRVISEHRARLRADPRVTLRRSGGDWLEAQVAAPADAALALELFELAVAAHRPARGEAVRLPPTGAALARRRRFH